jgi:hypothetical protein
MASCIRSKSVQLQGGVVVDHSHLEGPVRLGLGSMVHDVHTMGEPLELLPDTVLHQAIVRSAEGSSSPVISVIYHVYDDPKELAEAGRCCWFGQEIYGWLAQRGVPAEAVWPDIEPAARCLWNAKLFPASSSSMGFRDVLWMQVPALPLREVLRAWLASPRYSMADVQRDCDSDAMMARRRHLQAVQAVYAALETARQNLTGLCSEPLEALHLPDTCRIAAQRLWQAIDVGVPPLEASRLFMALAELAQRMARDLELIREPLAREGEAPAEPLVQRNRRPLAAGLVLAARSTRGRATDDSHGRLESLVSAALEARDWQRAARTALRWLDWHPDSAPPWEALGRVAEELAFDSVRRAVQVHAASPFETPRARLRSSQRVTALAPARADLGGGWSDTPPYTLEWGGAVVNLAIDLGGAPPIEASARVLDEPIIRFITDELDQPIEIHDLGPSFDRIEPSDPVALHRAALRVAGIVPLDRSVPARLALEYFGGGIELCTRCRLPKGSGLGTSSILGAATLAALFRLTGAEPSRAQLILDTLVLEQVLTTGGGWQDQVGGIYGGLKFSCTEPGPPQAPSVLPIELPANVRRQIEERLVVIHTGQQRMA